VAKIRFSWRLYGHRLRVTRMALGITEKEAADAHGASLKTYRKWENGGPQRQKASALLHFAEKFDVSTDWLVCGETARVGNHLSKHAKGKIAILPAMGRIYRRRHNAQHEITPGAA
jgi:transcriptional regulator with XRE-family HTH domain